MGYGFLETLKTPSIEAARDANGSGDDMERLHGPSGLRHFTENEREFIGQRDSFYVATVAENGWPYMQHRGGPPGFLRVLNDRTLGFADFRGNRQYITVGNVSANGRVALFLMDYPRRAPENSRTYGDQGHRQRSRSDSKAGDIGVQDKN